MSDFKASDAAKYVAIRTVIGGSVLGAAATGAAVGSVIPVIGTGVGAIAGVAALYFGARTMAKKSLEKDSSS